MSVSVAHYNVALYNIIYEIKHFIVINDHQMRTAWNANVDAHFVFRNIPVTNIPNRGGSNVNYSLLHRIVFAT